MSQNVPEPRYVPPSRPGYTPPGELEGIAENIREEPVFPCCPMCGCKLPVEKPHESPIQADCPNCRAHVRVDVARREPGNQGGKQARA